MISVPRELLDRSRKQYWDKMKCIFSDDRDRCLVCGQPGPKRVFNYWLIVCWGEPRGDETDMARLCCNACLQKHSYTGYPLREVLMLYHLASNGWKP